MRSVADQAAQYSHYNEYRGVQAPYIKLTGNNDAICVAWTTITWPNGLDWTISGGAVASYCKAAPGYPSYAILGNDENGRRHRPDCFWIVSTFATDRPCPASKS